MNDAVFQAAELLSKRPEKRRAIIVLSDGADTKSGNRSAQFASKLEEKTNELKERMAKAFKGRDEVNQKTRKNSVQT